MWSPRKAKERRIQASLSVCSLAASPDFLEVSFPNLVLIPLNHTFRSIAGKKQEKTKIKSKGFHYI